MKNLYLIRGVSGAGKTAFVRSIVQSHDVVVANDDFMLDKTGAYKFDWRKLEEVGIKCRNTVKKAMDVNTERIFVYNTFTTKKEMEPYFVLAKEHVYKIFTIIIENRGGWKSAHDIPESTKEKQKKRFDIEL